MYFLEAAVVHQFKQYLANKYNHTEHDIHKREVNKKSEDQQKLWKQFLQDVYPGMKRPPNEMVELMTSPNPDKTMNIIANINPPEDPCKITNEKGKRDNVNE